MSHPQPRTPQSRSKHKTYTTPGASQPPTSRDSTSRKRNVDIITISDDEDHDYEDAVRRAQLLSPEKSGSPKKRVKKNPDASEVEKRPGAFRKKPPQKYLERLERALSQRMFLLDRTSGQDENGYLMETFNLAGTTGNIYEVQISRTPRCSCPDAKKGNQCKHIIYILSNVLKAEEHFAYQLYFLSSELETIFSHAPATAGKTQASEDSNVKRRPIEGDCPICMSDMNESAGNDDIVWCKTGCGNNMHKECFNQWAKHKTGQTRCVLCRTPWEQNIDKGIQNRGTVTEEGYRNIAQELNISGVRDHTTYYNGPFRGYNESGRYY